MKYSKEKTEEIAGHLRTGVNREDACVLSDISKDTFYEWMKKPDFSDAIKKAETACKQRNIALIQKAALTSWQAAAWMLERKYHDEFGVKQKLEHSGQVAGRFVLVCPDGKK